MKKLLFALLIFCTTAKAQVKDTLVDFLPPLTKAVSGNTVSVSVNFTTINDSLKKHRADIQSLQAFDNTQKATNTSLQNQINNIVVPPSVGVPQPVTIVTSQTIGQLPYNTDIYLKCPRNSVVTFGAAPQAGWRYRIHNIGGYSVAIAVNGVTRVNSVSSIAVGSRPLDVSYQSANTVEIH